MPTVVLKRSAYDYEKLKPAFFEIMDAIGGSVIAKNSRVVIKPNLLGSASPDRAMITHPLVVRAAVEYVLQKGGLPQVSDSPATGQFEKILEDGGFTGALEGLDAEMKEFSASVPVDIGEPFKKIEIARDAVEADVIINLPKLKTHSQMLLTLGVKNLFGCVVGLRKPEWHFRAGVDRDLFARLLVQISSVLKPCLTVIDGILAMEGQGPGKSGTPKELGILIGSSDPVSLDIAVCRILGILPQRVFTNRIAVEMGLDKGPPEIKGDDIPSIDVKLPEITPLVFGPEPLHGFMRRHLVQRPETDNNSCKLCGECWEYCPASAISHNKKKKRILFDYDKCIRCYCCIEVCPYGALSTRETLPGKIMRWILTKKHFRHQSGSL